MGKTRKTNTTVLRNSKKNTGTCFLFYYSGDYLHQRGHSGKSARGGLKSWFDRLTTLSEVEGESRRALDAESC
jgi:hypothetical protein